MSNPSTAKELQQRLPAFIMFLKERGASVMSQTSEWEVLRFIGDSRLSVVYRNKNNKLTFTGAAFAAWKAFDKHQHIDLTNHTLVKRHNKAGPTIRALRERDGDFCFYCVEFVREEDASVEHLLAIIHGGSNHMSNLALAHKACNVEAGHQDLLHKMRIRERAILKKAYFDRLGAKDERADTEEEAHLATSHAGCAEVSTEAN